MRHSFAIRRPEKHSVHAYARGVVSDSLCWDFLLPLTLTWLRSQANGQNCIGIERYLVHRSRYQEFLNIMTPRVKKLRCGAALSSPSSGKTMNVVDCGAMISSRLLTQLEDMLQLAEKQGARILAGGKRFSHPDWPEGHYFQPTLIADVTSQMDIATKEREFSTPHYLAGGSS